MLDKALAPSYGLLPLGSKCSPFKWIWPFSCIPRTSQAALCEAQATAKKILRITSYFLAFRQWTWTETENDFYTEVYIHTICVAGVVRIAAFHIVLIIGTQVGNVGRPSTAILYRKQNKILHNIEGFFRPFKYNFYHGRQCFNDLTVCRQMPPSLPFEGLL